MLADNSLIVIGGTGRNVGKTKSVCQLIRRHCGQQKIYGLKVSTIFPDESLYHGDHSRDPEAGCLFEEKSRDTHKDTSRMLRAGAHRVYYLRADDSNIATLYHDFRRRLPAGAIVICESNSLSQHVCPGLFIMICSSDTAGKPRAQAQLDRADLVIVSDGVSGLPELMKISLADDGKWLLDGR